MLGDFVYQVHTAILNVFMTLLRHVGKTLHRMIGIVVKKSYTKIENENSSKIARPVLENSNLKASLTPFVQSIGAEYKVLPL